MEPVSGFSKLRRPPRSAVVMQGHQHLGELVNCDTGATSRLVKLSRGLLERDLALGRKDAGGGVDNCDLV